MSARFEVGDEVLVADRWPESAQVRTHIRAPYFVRGRAGTVERVLGAFPNPEELAFGKSGLPEIPLYMIRFRASDLWAEGGFRAQDSLTADVYEHWLEKRP